MCYPELICVDDKVETANLRETELAISHTRRVDFLPDPLHSYNTGYQMKEAY